MDNYHFLEEKGLITPNKEKIILLVADGLGGLPHPDFNFKTELEAASTPNLDALTKKSALGLTIPVKTGVTPGSGPAHLSLLGYDPLEYAIGRGVLETLGAGFALQPDDLAARGNFATRDNRGIIIDRRAGRISTEKGNSLVERLSKNIKKLEDTEVVILPGKEHRLVVIFRGKNLSEKLQETDPQKEGLLPLPSLPLGVEGEKTAKLVTTFLTRVNTILQEEKEANTILLRGFAKLPQLENFPKRFKLKSLALATYPMYKGIARVMGMDTPDIGDSFAGLIDYLSLHFAEYDFVYLHKKEIDKAGEDGNFKAKVLEIEKLDNLLPKLLQLGPNVLAITSDHSTPSFLKGHSWHPNPLLIYSPFVGVTGGGRFTERECKNGYLGVINSLEVMSLILANALKLKKYGA